MSTPKKRTVRDYHTDVSPYELEGTLVEIRTRIQDWIDKYGPTARFDWDAHFYHDYDTTPSPRFNIVHDREETDEEYQERLHKEKKDLSIREAQERAEFERLQKKFGGK